MSQKATLLKVLVEQKEWRFVDFQRRFRRVADQILKGNARSLTISESTYRRWTSGRMATLPGIETCKVLEHLFGVDAASLLGPPPSSSDLSAPKFDLEGEIAMTARDAQSEASATAAESISDTTLDQLREDVTALARDYSGTAAFDVWRRAKELREEAESARERTQVPAQKEELLILAGQACALLATAAFDLGSLDSARRLCRAAALYGETARFNPLRAFAGGTLAYIAYFQNRPSEGARFARQAQAFTGLGDVAVRRLAAIEARAHAYAGDVASARRALTISQQLGPGLTDDLHDEVSGEFGFNGERLAMSTSSTYLLIGDGEGAEAAAMQSLELATARPAAGRAAKVIGGAAADLAMARLLRNDLEGAVDAMPPVWEIPRGQRSPGILTRTARVRRALGAAPYRNAPQAIETADQIEDFTRESATHQLGPGAGPLAALES
ncbi:DNA-binding protein [Streptomyces noursei]|uniref:DNA-binding protein n=1 Tax=Streptomyces noursei TaxID=1971 RepID=UPI0023B874DC|nr:DNA-binding protein [Streptomyces noursei]